MATKTATRGNTYMLTSKGAKNLAEASGQQAPIFHVLSAGKPLTAAEITAKVASKLKTKQDAGLVVGFYLTQWKGDSLVKFGPKAAKQ